jgi:HK97 family phage major capsid protein
MPYNNLVSRTSAQALIPEVVSNDILGGLTNESAALQMFRQVRMATNQTRMPVLSALPTAYFVTGDTGLKQTTQVDWSNKFLNVEELATIVPIPEAVFDDANFDVWGNIRPLLTDAIARALDAAVIFGTNKPASWAPAIVTDATSAGNVVNRSVGTPRTDKAGLAGYFSDAFAQVEADGFAVNGIVANTIYKGLLRNTRDANGNLLAEVSPSSVFGETVSYPMRGLWPAAGVGAAEAIAGDFTQAILGRPSGHHLQGHHRGRDPGQHRGHPVQPAPAGHDRAPGGLPVCLPDRQHDQLRQPHGGHPLPVLGHQAGRLSLPAHRARPG